jgi:hypothetical protein
LLFELETLQHTPFADSAFFVHDYAWLDNATAACVTEVKVMTGKNFPLLRAHYPECSVGLPQA